MKPIFIAVITFVALLSFAPSLVSADSVHNPAGQAGRTSPSLATTSTSVLPGVLGGYVFAGQLVTPVGSGVASAGPLFPVGLGCGTTAKTYSASAATMSLGKTASSGSLVDKLVTTRTATTAAARGSSTIQNVRLLGGQVIASTVSAVAVSKATATSASSGSGSTFVGLVVAGKAISVAPGPNTVVGLPGIGYVVLNERSGPYNSTNATNVSVTAIDVHVTVANSLGLPVGTRILIARASTNFVRTSFPAVVGASGYGLYTHGFGGSLSTTSGPWAQAGIGCTGGSTTVSLSSLTLTQATAGTMQDEATGQFTTSNASAAGRSSIATMSLLGGLVKATAVRSTGHAAVSTTGTAWGSTTFHSVTVAGKSVATSPGPNTRVNIPGLGYVILNEQSKSRSATSASINVNAMDVYITTANTLGIPVGARMVVAHSSARATAYS